MGLRDRLRGLLARPAPTVPAARRVPEAPRPIHPVIGVRVPVAGGVPGARVVSVGEDPTGRDRAAPWVVVAPERWEAAAEAEWLAANGFRSVGWREGAA